MLFLFAQADHQAPSSFFALTASPPQSALNLTFSLGSSSQLRFQTVNTHSTFLPPLWNVPLISYFNPATTCFVIFLMETSSKLESPEAKRAKFVVKISFTILSSTGTSIFPPTTIWVVDDDEPSSLSYLIKLTESSSKVKKMFTVTGDATAKATSTNDIKNFMISLSFPNH